MIVGGSFSLYSVTGGSTSGRGLHVNISASPGRCGSLSWSVVLQTKALRSWFAFRARAWVVSSSLIRAHREATNWCFSLTSMFLFPPFSSLGMSFFCIKILKNCYWCSFTVAPILPPLPSSAQPTFHSHSQSPSRCPCPWVIHTCSLTNPFPFFPPLYSSPLPSPLWPLSVCSMFPCLWFYFAHKVILFIRFLL